MSERGRDMRIRRIIAGAAAIAMMSSTLSSTPLLAAKNKVKYAKTEIEKANAACVISMLVGGIGGAVIGGKKGAAIGLGTSALLCVVLQVNARNKDRILAAQAATAQSGEGEYQEAFRDDQGRTVVFSGQRGESEIVDAVRLQPVKYTSPAGEKLASPVFETGGQECRKTASSLNYSSGQATALPEQVFCRTAEGDWYPYAVRLAAR